MSSEIIGELGQVGLRISESQAPDEGSNCSDISESQVIHVTEPENKKRSPKCNHYSYRAKKFRYEWMRNDIFKDWLKPHTCPELAVCTACNRTIKAGKSELEKHASGKKHIKMLKLGSTCASSTGSSPTESHTPNIVLVNQDAQQNYTETTFVVNLAADFKGENGGGDGSSYNTGGQSQYVEVTQYEASAGTVQATSRTQPTTQSQSQVAIVESSRASVCSNESKPHIILSHAQSPEPRITHSPVLSIPQSVPPLKNHVLKGAPHWKATAVVNGHVTSLDLNDYKGRYLIMFFYTHDFCKVSCSEVNSVSDAMADLRALGAEAVACSVDSYLCHLTWCKMTRLDNGVQGSKVALLSDPTHKICQDYGVYDQDKGHALRSCFVIDKRGVMRHMSINDSCIGRGTGEVIRLLRAIQHYDRTEEMCLADWKPND